MSELGMNETMLPERDDQSQQSGKAVGSPGTQLAAQRKALGWSIEDVAEQLKLAPRQVIALEADNYAALPGMAIVRGFVRAYAKILRIDAQPLVSMIAVEPIAPKPTIPLRHEMAAPFSEVRFPSMDRRGLPAVWLAGLVIVFLLVVILGGQQMGWLPSANQFASKLEREAPSVPASVTSAPANPATNKPSENAASVKIEPNIPLPVAVTKPAISAPVVATPATSTTSAATPTENALVLKFRQDSWVEIKRANSTSIISRVVKAGSTETFEIKEPVQLIIGNVAGVDANLRGAPLSLKSGTGNTARLNLK